MPGQNQEIPREILEHLGMASSLEIDEEEQQRFLEIENRIKELVVLEKKIKERIKENKNETSST